MTVDDGPVQLVLPLLDRADTITVDRTRVAVQRATEHALAAGRRRDAAELAAIGADLLDLLDRNAANHRLLDQ